MRLDILKDASSNLTEILCQVRSDPAHLDYLKDTYSKKLA